MSRKPNIVDYLMSQLRKDREEEQMRRNQLEDSNAKSLSIVKLFKYLSELELQHEPIEIIQIENLTGVYNRDTPLLEVRIKFKPKD